MLKGADCLSYENGPSPLFLSTIHDDEVIRTRGHKSKDIRAKQDHNGKVGQEDVYESKT